MMKVMKVNVNGKAIEIPTSCSIEGLLEQLGLSEAACAVEVNTSLVPKRRHAEHEICEDDTIEIVSLVGGG